MEELVFLGTGGGRYTTLFQSRSTGGIIYRTGEHQVHIDPGPGALLRCRECKVYPFKTDILIATHPHIDHVNDLKLIIEGVTYAATKKRGTLITTKEVIDETVREYHKNLLKEVITLSPGQNTAINGLRIEAVKCVHSHDTCFGVKFYTKNYCLYYTSDTSIYPGFESNLKDVDVLVANVILPGNKGLSHHMASDDLISGIKNSKHKLKLVIITHFDTQMLRAGPDKEAERIEKITGVKTVAAQDSLVVKINY